MTDPTVTVLICTYNQASFLSDALESVRRQTLPSAQYETIVVNDGSTDETSEILAEHDDWIRAIDRSENRGLVPSCNEGIEAANGQYVARLDSDDYVTADWLEQLVETAREQPDAVCVSPDRYEFQPDNGREYVAVDSTDVYSLVAAGPLLDLDAVRAVGGYRSVYWEEYDLYLRLHERGAFVRVAEPLYFYRRHEGGMTADANRRREGWIELLEHWGRDTLLTAGDDPGLDSTLKWMEEEDTPDD